MTDLKELTAGVVAAYVGNTKVGAGDLPALIQNIYATLGGLDQPDLAPAQDAAKKLTAAQIRKSVTDEAIISFEDGKAYRTLKRHLTLHGLTPQAYRSKWGLPADYPITAPSYSAKRSELARHMGLGRRAALSTANEPVPTPAVPEPVPQQAFEARSSPESAPSSIVDAAVVVKAVAKTSKSAKAKPAAASAPRTPPKVRPPKAIDPASDEFT